MQEKVKNRLLVCVDDETLNKLNEIKEKKRVSLSSVLRLAISRLLHISDKDFVVAKRGRPFS